MTGPVTSGIYIFMTQLKPESLPDKQGDLYDLLKTHDWLKEYYLAGGTGLALQIGHRESVDFDFFTSNEIIAGTLETYLGDIGEFRRTYEERNTLYGELKGIRVSFIRYSYPLIEEPAGDLNMRVAGLKDIAAMKLSAILGRGTRKDFIDLYYLLKTFSLKEVLSFYEIKYRAENYQYTLLRSLQYFEAAAPDPMPSMREPVSWEHIKQTITALVREYDLI